MNKIYHSKSAKSKNVIINMIITGLSLFLITFWSVQVSAANITYIYDSLSRLTKVDYDNGAAITYTYDHAGNRLTLISTPPPDLTPPTTPLIIDDGVYTLDLAQLHAMWNANDPETGLAECQYAIGTTSQGSDVMGWTTFFCSNNSLTHSGLNLLDGVTYYISFKVRNAAGLWSDIGSSDGILTLSVAGDYDGDGLTNDDEVNIHGTNPLASDTDGDGMPDGWEIQYGLSPLDPGDATTDPDGDDFTNLQEYQKGTSPIDSLSHPPVSLAGRDQNVLTGASVTLDGSDSTGQDGGLITFDWTQTFRPTNSTATLSDPNIPRPIFTPDKDGYYSYDLIACDAIDLNNCSGPDSVTINASTINVPPNADAGPDQKVITGQGVLLDGLSSNDADTGQGSLIYNWSFVSVPQGSTLTNQNITGSNTPVAGFIPDVDGVYEVDLTVSDSINTTHDQVLIIAGAATPPVAKAGADQIAALGQGVSLDGSGSYDQDGLPQLLTYQWRFVSIPVGSALTNSDITNANTISAGFTPDMAGSYVLQLAVNDGQYTSTDNVIIIMDGISPAGSIIINNNNAWTSTSLVSLALSCTDGINGSGCSEMRFSDDAITWTSWESYTAGRSWTLVGGDGVRTVYVQYKDIASNVSAAFSDTIILQTQTTVGVTLVPDSISIPRGGTLRYTVTLINTTSTSKSFKYWTYIKMPNGSRYPATGELFGPVTVTVAPGQLKSAPLTHSIPTIAPLGTYTYYGQIGTYPSVFDSDSFQFSVTPSLTPQRTIQTEWQLLENIDIDAFEVAP